MITAKLAAEQGKEVFAKPSLIHNPLSKGCHQLIKQGAKLTDNIEDILSELPKGLGLSVPFKKSLLI
ncbi:DNA-processing protein DprA [Abyssogena phaseoliformis symbiont]|uniref:DNA-processing protein DprA n=1 Tax=Abyssogena phaseoliformis symbiont TaxID=596095 RepID=UPI001CEC52A0|nr:DNA-processing protein DprA [Abyssogena phaseoliformis symbiont]